jgi:hypothetical protein
MPSAKRITAKYANHVWHVDLTTVPTAAGFWTSWLPFALPSASHFAGGWPSSSITIRDEHWASRSS